MTGAVPLKRAVAWCLHHSGALDLRRSLFERGWAVLLTYHRVSDEGDPFFPSLPRSVFVAQLDYVAARYRVEPLEDVATWLAEGAEGPPRVALTIDDGYPDTLEVVLPELERRGLPATLFLSTGPPETGAPLWTDRTRWIFKYARASTLDVPALGLLACPLDGSAARLGILDRFLPLLKALGPTEIESTLVTLEAGLEPQGPPLPLLRWDGVRRLARGPITLGGHCHRHYILSHLDDGGQEDEIATGLRLIEARTGVRVRCFAYPNGERADYDERAIAVLRQLGLRCAVTARHALARPGQDPFQLPRFYTTEPSLSLFAARLAGLGREQPGETRLS